MDELLGPLADLDFCAVLFLIFSGLILCAALFLSDKN
jgi:hypothetical protein